MRGRPRGAAQAGEVRGLIAPTAQGDLVLPTAAVAEVVAYAGEARARPGGPAWFLGELDWRGQRLPLIDLGTSAEEMPTAGEAGSHRRRPCVLICFTPNGNRALPYVGFLVADSPHLLRIRATDLAPRQVFEKRPFVHLTMELQGRAAWLPDLDEAERQGLLLGRPSG